MTVGPDQLHHTTDRTTDTLVAADGVHAFTHHHQNDDVPDRDELDELKGGEKTQDLRVR